MEKMLTMIKKVQKEVVPMMMMMRSCILMSLPVKSWKLKEMNVKKRGITMITSSLRRITVKFSQITVKLKRIRMTVKLKKIMLKMT